MNIVTKQVDCDFYGDKGGKLEIKDMKDNITFVIERMEKKDKEMVTIGREFQLGVPLLNIPKDRTLKSPK